MAFPDLDAVSLALLVLFGTYTTFLCGRPPNPTPYNSKEADTMKFAVTPTSLLIRCSIDVTLGILHAILCLTYPSPPSLLCPSSSDLNPSLFTWTPRSIISIATILLGSAIRLYAFRMLGRNFTFRLAKPKTLITSGMYKYVQHPSYIGKALIVLGNLIFLQPPGGVVGCWLPAWIVSATPFWEALFIFLAVGAGWVTWKRVSEEEAMMKDAFGEEWERWHQKTWRFVPGLF
ncbi:hypothetical protein N431DRAFT_436729 [Stipitochalara longipes BDJ]|nr:hypothetical protein N431DRAFT_436729 [Stipitochalara longipes BDJ]